MWMYGIPTEDFHTSQFIQDFFLFIFVYWIACNGAHPQQNRVQLHFSELQYGFLLQSRRYLAIVVPAMLKTEQPTHIPYRNTFLICLSDSVVSETRRQREGIYYRIDLVVQLGGNRNFSFHFLPVTLISRELWGRNKVIHRDGWQKNKEEAGCGTRESICVAVLLWEMWEVF